MKLDIKITTNDNCSVEIEDLTPRGNVALDGYLSESASDSAWDGSHFKWTNTASIVVFATTTTEGGTEVKSV
jgi:hypothetical protein